MSIIRVTRWRANVYVLKIVCLLVCVAPRYIPRNAVLGGGYPFFKVGFCHGPEINKLSGIEELVKD
jgi:hypothetical protein